jgi:hypothetical protein
MTAVGGAHPWFSSASPRRRVIHFPGGERPDVLAVSLSRCSAAAKRRANRGYRLTLFSSVTRCTISRLFDAHFPWWSSSSAERADVWL